MKSNKTKSAMTALVIAAMICTAAMPVKAEESKWVNNDGNWSLIKADGKKATGWVKDGECWYAFDENGSMRTGWVASHEHWYYMGESGVMQVNTLVEDNGAKYFVKGTGVMAKDYVKDGYEFTSDGKAIPLSESKSVVLTDAAELEGKVIEGNLYVDVTTAKEIELKGVTVKGKLIIIGDNETEGKLTLTDSTVETINTQSRNSEVVLSGDTEVKNIVIEETAKVTTDKDYKGKVENFEIQSTTKGTVVVEVPAENVTTNSYATVDVQAPVENLEVRTETEVKVNSDVKNVTVAETAKDTIVEVAKGNKVGTITADAPVKIDGKGTVEKVEANVDGVEAGKDTTIKEVETGKDVTEAPDVTKPDTGGSSGGNDSGPTYYTVTYKVDDSITFDTPSSVSVSSGSTITEPGKPVDASEGYAYKWVTSDGKPFDFSSKVRSSMTLTLILTSNDFVGGNGSENYPYLINSSAQITKIGDHFNKNVGYNYKLISDITIPSNHTVMQKFIGVFDGDGHTITLPDSDSGVKYKDGKSATPWFAFSTYGDSTFKNFTIEHGNQGILPMIELANMNADKTDPNNIIYESAINYNTILFDSITINPKNGVVNVTANDNNEAPLLVHSGALNTTFKNVENNISYKRISGNVYVSFYVGGYIQTKKTDLNVDRNKNLNFINCSNTGDMDVTYASLYLGNGTSSENLTINVNGCTNTGILNGYTASEPFAAIGHANLTNEMKTKNSELKDDNYTNIDQLNVVYTDNKYTFSYEGAEKYYVTYTAYARYANGTTMISVDLDNEDLSSTTSKYGRLKMIAYSEENAEKYNSVKFIVLNSYGMEYYVDEIDNVIVIKLGDIADYEGITLNSNTTVTVTAVDSNGDVIAIGTAR